MELLLHALNRPINLLGGFFVSFSHCRVKYKELLFNLNELQSEKTAIQQKFEFGVSSVKAFKADMKVKISVSLYEYSLRSNNLNNLFI